MKKKCYNEECDWEVTYVTLRVCFNACMWLSACACVLFI